MFFFIVFLPFSRELETLIKKKLEIANTIKKSILPKKKLKITSLKIESKVKY
jgi:hypothetical protein